MYNRSILLILIKKEFFKYNIVLCLDSSLHNKL
ncbi:MAG: hypothetical protein METHAR1v1_770002 [Methanothrix sp.]|nr:MAG: hypothetical protein METHAR1v1_770002 [Methanothrix sp.]